MTIERDQCIDAGSEYCPCYLAEMNCCITCTRLKNKDYCDCNWRGVCIYQEYHYLNYKKKDPRQYQEVNILQREEVGNNLLIFTLKTPHTLARQLKQPGSYIFIRNRNLEHYFDIPISIMEVDESNDYIKIAVEIHGVKTQSIKDINDTLLIRGPYWNGLFGLEHLKKAKNLKCLFITRGVAQAPAILAINYLMRNNNEVDVVIDPGKAYIKLIEEYTKANVIEDGYDLYSQEGKGMLRKHLTDGKYQLVFVGGSDYLQENLLKIFEDYNDLNLVLTNNKEICCGEGICGACVVYDADGIPIRSCKTQIVHKK
ncbi:sulfide/dihydroorotate dehydrogenase-like FAD/NAD-binding protein [Alkaliphilus transvaalensis]|uniref:sulfide/dihydroorotate dehydrogenase-like FAD/NAD-binding protein n=1 Tax=Alkaliphilus transvaalensis TaxID=114628 RepID=UPI00047AEDCA|nr:sulfide/dihydroorotate dehydrogenase-like FAD/NAD-binding protein [Alkaliphilus transvaalensis]